jgi:signal transduction histidine kinase
MDVRLTVQGAARPPAQVHQALCRIAEEALNNATRHSGAGTAWVEL